VMYAQRALAGRLERDMARLAAEREDRARLGWGRREDAHRA